MNISNLLYCFSVLFITFFILKFLGFTAFYFSLITQLVSSIQVSFLKILGTTVLLEKYIYSHFSFTNVAIVITVLLLIACLYLQEFFSRISFPVVLTRNEVIMISFTGLVVFVNFNLFWVIEYLTMLSKHTWQIVPLKHSLEGFIDHTLYLGIISCSILFMFLTICSNLFIVFHLAVKFYYAYLAEVEFLVKRLLLILPKIKSLNTLVRIFSSYFCFILLVCLSVSVLLTVSHTLDLFFVYKDLDRILKILLAKNEYMNSFFLIEMMMVWAFIILIERGVHDLEEIFEHFFIFYRSLFLFLAMILPFYPPVL